MPENDKNKNNSENTAKNDQKKQKIVNSLLQGYGKKLKPLTPQDQKKLASLVPGSIEELIHMSPQNMKKLENLLAQKELMEKMSDFQQQAAKAKKKLHSLAKDPNADKNKYQYLSSLENGGEIIKLKESLDGYFEPIMEATNTSWLSYGAVPVSSAAIPFSDGYMQPIDNTLNQILKQGKDYDPRFLITTPEGSLRLMKVNLSDDTVEPDQAGVPDAMLSMARALNPNAKEYRIVWGSYPSTAVQREKAFRSYQNYCGMIMRYRDQLTSNNCPTEIMDRIHTAMAAFENDVDRLLGDVAVANGTVPSELQGLQNARTNMVYLENQLRHSLLVVARHKNAGLEMKKTPALQVKPKPAKKAEKEDKKEVVSAPANVKPQTVSQPRPANVVTEPVKPAPKPVNVVTEPVKPAPKPANVVTEPTKPVPKPANVVTEPVKPAPKPANVVTEPAKEVPPVPQTAPDIPNVPNMSDEAYNKFLSDLYARRKAEDAERLKQFEAESRAKVAEKYGKEREAELIQQFPDLNEVAPEFPELGPVEAPVNPVPAENDLDKMLQGLGHKEAEPAVVDINATENGPQMEQSWTLGEHSELIAGDSVNLGGTFVSDPDASVVMSQTIEPSTPQFPDINAPISPVEDINAYTPPMNAQNLDPKQQFRDKALEVLTKEFVLKSIEKRAGDKLPPEALEVLHSQPVLDAFKKKMEGSKIFQSVMEHYDAMPPAELSKMGGKDMEQQLKFEFASVNLQTHTNQPVKVTPQTPALTQNKQLEQQNIMNR